VEFYTVRISNSGMSNCHQKLYVEYQMVRTLNCLLNIILSEYQTEKYQTEKYQTVRLSKEGIKCQDIQLWNFKLFEYLIV